MGKATGGSRRFYSLLAGIALSLSTAAPLAHAADSVDINVLLPLTGGASFLGKGEQKALQILEKSVNDSGGIQGRPLRLIYQDDQSSPQVAVQLATQLIAQRPNVILGSALVGMCNAMAPLMASGPVMYCFSPGIHPKPGAYVFTSSVSTVDTASALIRYFRMKGWTKIALLTSTDASGQDAERGIKEVLSRPENKDVQLIENAHFNPGDVTVTAQIERIKGLQPHALIAWSTGAPIGTVFKALAQAGVDMPIGTTFGNMTYEQMTQYASFLPKNLYISSSRWPEHESKEADVQKAHTVFFDAYKAAGLSPDISSTLSWDPASIVIDALKALGPQATAEQLREHIAKLKGYAGVNGVYDFVRTPQRGLAEQDTVVTIWDAEAKTWRPVSKPTGIPLD